MSSSNSQKQTESHPQSPFTKFSENQNQTINQPIAISKLFKPLNLIQEPNSTSTLSTQKANTLEENMHFPIIVPSLRFDNFNKINIKNINNLSDNSNQKNYNKYSCTCSKTKCIKKYCECFANGRLCIGCHCIDCLNKPIFQKNENEINQNLNNDIANNNNDISVNNNNDINVNNNNDNSINSDNLIQNDISFISCTCSKSFCNKKYCECFKAGKKCSEKCRCLHCLNGNNNNEINDNFLNEDNFYNNNNDNNLNKIKPEDFIMQTTSVFISNKQTIIHVEKKGKEEMKLIALKRNRDNA